MINPQVIADYLNYKRPTKVTYPVEGRVIDPNVVVRQLYDDINDYEKNMCVHPIGLMKEKCRLVNKVIHHNLFPRGKESTPSEKVAEFLYICMKSDEVVDYAQWIFRQLVEFRTQAMSHTKMPFPVMISEICKDSDAKRLSNEKLEPLKPGPLNASSEAKSKSSSKPTPIAKLASYTEPKERISGRGMTSGVR